MSNRSSHFANRLQTMISAIRAAPLRVLFLAVAVAVCGLMTVTDLTPAAPVHAQEQAVTATRDATGESPPARPTDLQASAEPDSVSLAWTASTDQTVTHYAVLLRDRDDDVAGVFHVIDSNAGSGLSYTDRSVSPGGSYVYRVKAVSPTGVSQWSSYARADIPADPEDLAPSGLSAKAVFDGGDSAGVELAWDVPAEDAESVTGYEVLRAQGAGDLATLVADTGSADASYTDVTATEAGETYSYVVIALRGEEKSRQSNLASVGLPPARPTGLTTSATHEAVTLTWDDPGDDGITHYEVYRRVTGQDSLGDFELIETDTGSAEAGYTDDDVPPETRYTYRVKAVNAHGASLWSEDSSVTTPAAPEAAPDPDPASSAADLAPGGLAARVVYGTGAEPAGVELSWNAPAEDAESVTGYEILRARGDAEPATLVADTGSTGTSFTDGAATEAGERYVYRVKAVRGQERSQASEEARASVPQLASSRGNRSVVTGSQSADVTNQQIWSAAVTAGANSIFTGFISSVSASSLSDQTVTSGGVDYFISLIAIRSSNESLVINFEPELPQALIDRWTLVAGGNEYQFANAHTPSFGNSRRNTFTWINAGLSWSAGEEIPVSIKEEQNVDASGTVVILGKPYVGQTLTAGTSGIEDPNGVPNRFPHQWKAGNADIPGATGSTYTLRRGDLGKTFKVEVSFTDDAGYKESLTSGATPAVGEQIREVWTAKMTVGTGPSGQLGYHSTDYEGDSLSDTSFTTSAGDHTVRQISIHLAEIRFTVTGKLPEVAEEDWPLYLGNLQFPLANATKQVSSLVTAFSWREPKPAWQSGDKVDVALWRVNVPATGAPAIKGATQVGDLLSVGTRGIRDSDGIPEDVAFTYQWFSRDGDDDVDIPSATGSSYVVTGQEPSNFLRVRVGFTDGNGFQEIVVSNAAVWPQLGEIWTAALTAGQKTSFNRTGFGFDFEGGALSDATFTYAGTDYRISTIDTTPGGRLGISMDSSFAEGDASRLILDVGGHPFRFSDRDPNQSNLDIIPSHISTVAWTDTGISWSRGDVVRLALKTTNLSAEGARVIRGAPRADDVLTVDASGITDGNGIPDDVVFSYQWFYRDADEDRDFPGATGPSFPLDASHLGKRIGVKVSFIDADGYAESVVADPTTAVGERAHKFWTATVTLKPIGTRSSIGYDSNEAFAPGSSITDGTVVFESSSYVVEGVIFTGFNNLEFALSPKLTDEEIESWILDTNLGELHLADALLHLQEVGGATQATFIWSSQGHLAWSDGDMIPLALKVLNSPVAGLPVIKGAPRVDDVLIADTSGITDANGIPEDVVFSYQWFNGATLQDIPGATGATLTLDSSHLGLTIGVKVGFTDAHGYEESSTSDVTARVGERAHKFWTATLTATRSSGSAVVSIVGYPAPLFPGSSLTDATVTYEPNTYSVESVQLTGSDETSLSVRFSQAPTEGEVDTWILDVNGKEYFPSQSTTPAASDPDRTFLWENSGLSWSDGEVISLALKVLNRPAQGRPSISGTPKLGETLTADTSGITDPDGIPDDAVFTYQWVSFDVVVVRDIAGATGPSYTITRDREGDVLGVRVGFADSRGFDESVTSGPVVSPQSGDLWVAALTVGRNAALDQNGFGDDFAGGALTDATFSHAGKNYTFNSISVDKYGGLLLLLRPELTELDANLLDFYVRVHPYHFSHRSSSESSLNLNDSGQALIVWADAALIWGQGDVIRLALKAANQPAGGTPVIKGALRVDDVLTADTSGITDGNGIPEDVVFSYQWFDGTGQDIPGATGARLPLDSSHLGLTIGVRVGFTDAEGYEESLPSDVTAPVAERAHKFWTATLTATRLSGSVVPIVGYPAPSFPGSSLIDATVTYGPNTYSVESVQLTGSDETSLSVRFSQAPTEGEVDTWILDVDGKEYFPSQSTTPAASDPDRAFLWENSGLSWSDGEVISLALKVLNQPVQGRPSISGTRKFGETLTAGTSGITDPNGIPDGAFTYQWFTVVSGAETEIPGANGPGYTIPRDQEGDFLRVRVGFTDSHGFDESVTSEEVVWRKSGEIWAALLTVGYNPGPNNYGFGIAYAGGSLSETLFRYFNKEFTTFRIRVNNNSHDVQFILRPNLSEEEGDVLTFRAGSKLLAFTDKDSSSTSANNQSDVRWTNTGLTWSKGDSIRVALSAANQDNTGTPVLLGEANVGRILTVDPSGITDPNGIPDDVAFTYQWIRCAGVPLSCEDIPGANGSSYQLTEADKDSYVGVRLNFHDALGYPEEKSSTVAGPVEAPSSTVGQHLLDSANTNPTGVWGDAATIWVANDERSDVAGRVDKIFAYHRSDLSRDSSKDFALHANNDYPYGIWSDGETMFVVERGGGKVYAYRMKDDPDTNEVDEYGAHDPNKDITLDGQNAGGLGIWANSATIWVSNEVNPDGALDKIFAYKLVDDPATNGVDEYGARDPGKDFNGLNSAGNNGPRGIWSDGDAMFVVNGQTGDYQVYAYRMSDGARVPRRDIALDDGNGNPRGAWGDEGELWVADDANTSRRLFRYFLPYPATGQPSILGDIEVGQTLTADVSGIADRNGLPDAFDYQWYRSDGTNDTPIDGATGSSYLLTGSDLGGSIRVKVSFLDEHSYEETLFSDRTRPLNAPATGAPLPLETARALSASLTAGSLLKTTGYFSHGHSFGSLSPSTFTVDGPSYTVAVLVVTDSGRVWLGLDKELDAGFTLTLDDASFSSGAVSDSGRFTNTTALYSYAWEDSGLSWGDGDVIPVSLHEDVEAKFPEVGDTLRAGVSGIVDLNGLPDAFAYQWRRYEGDQGTPISGATEGVYVLAPEDTGHRIGFRVSFTDDDGFPESLDSSLTPVVNDPARGKPTISGDLEVGQTLMADASAVTDRNGLPAAFTYQWFRLDGDARIAIQGASGSTYTLVSDDRGHRIMVRVTFADGDGFQEEVDSVPTMGVELINQQATGQPTVTVSGDLETGSTLTADISGIVDPNGLPDVFSYQWSRGEGSDFSPIPGAMESTYTLAPEDGGLQIRVKVTFTDDAGFLEEGLDPSDPTSVVNDRARGQLVIIIGELRVGGRLTADTSGITDRNGLPTSFTYWWFRSDGTNETLIPASGSSVLALDPAEAGHRIKVEVSFTDQDGFSERVKSEFTPKVGAINHAATGKPTITGDLETGAELTAATTGIQDQNGLPGTFAYQWFRSDGTGYAPIDEATESTYILASGDVGRRVKVRVTFTDNDGFSESLESDHTSPVAAKNIAATGKPTISGELRTGATLEVDTSGIRDLNGLPDTFAYQWFRSDGTNETPIGEATKSSYTLAAEDGGQRIKVQVTFTDDNGFSESRDSDLTAVINHSATGRPTISGSLVVGGTLTADPSEIADRNGLPGAFSYQWHHGAGDTPIAGATGSTYALTESDKGKSIRVEVSFVDSDGNQETLSSDLTEEVAAVDHPATGAVAVEGVLETGKTLRADTTAIADQNGLPPASSFRYQWLRGIGADETEINGAIESDYNLVSEDAGHHMKVVVSFTDRDGFEESIPSTFTQGTVLEVSVLTTEEGYAPRKLTFLDYRPENFLSWLNPSRAPYPSYHDDNEVVHRFEVQRRTRDLGQAWTGWEGLSLPEPPPRDSYNAVKLVVDGAERCQDREWRVRALYNDPQRHSQWVIAGEHNRPADGPPGGAVPDVAGSWLTVVGDSYQLGFSWRTVSRNCAWVTGWDVEQRHHLGWWFSSTEPEEGEKLRNRRSEGDLFWDSNTMTLDGNNVWTKWVNPYEGDGDGAGPQADDRLLTHSFQGSIDYQYRLRSRNEHGPSPWSMPMMFALGIRGQGHYVYFSSP